mgnify:CR=1 FL=1
MKKNVLVLIFGMINMTAIKILENLIQLSLLCGRKFKIGEMIEKLPKEQREILKTLKSDDIKTIRIK